MSRENNKYTRWRSSDNEEEDEEYAEGRRYLQPLEQPLEIHGDDEEDQMQEGRRVLAMATSNKVPEPILSSAAINRVVCISVLVCLFCILLGGLIGYLAASNSHPNVDISCMINNNNNSSTQSSVAPRVVSTSTSYPIDDGLVTNTPIPSTTTSSPTTTTTTPNKTTDRLPTVNVEDVESMSTLLLSHLTPELIRKYIENITSVRADKVKHVIQSAFEELGYDAETRMFPVMMSLPETSDPNTVEIILKNNSTKIINNATFSMKDQTPFSGFSPNGSVSGLLVYAHFARLEDFELLKSKGVTVNGTILLIRSCEIHPGIQVRNAEMAGAKGVIIYPEPVDHVGNSPEGKVYPDSMALPLDGVIWQNLRYIPGDPSTPFHPSSKNAYRIPPENYTGTPSIIVHPVSSESGKTLLSLLGGFEAPADWNGALLNKYYLGGTFKEDENAREVRITSRNFIAEEYSANIHAFSPAEDTSKVIHIGSRFESKGNMLTSTGLGLATLLALADAMQKTFPNGTRRQVVFSAFEAMDGDYSGGNEYSQLYSSWLESSGIAYIDIDTVIEGAGYLEANVSPLLRNTVREALLHVSWPIGEGLNVLQGLLRDVPADRLITNISDLQESFVYHNPFECDEAVNYHSIHGIPTVQLKGVSLHKNASYPLKNSQYDTIEALINVEDKNLKWTHMVASVIGVTAMMLSSLPLPLVKFEEVAYDLGIGWKALLDERRSDFNKSDIPLNDLISSISGEMDSFLLTVETYDTWYKQKKRKPNQETTEQNLWDVDYRVSLLIHFSRRFLRPRSAPQHADFGLHLTFGPDPINPCVGTYFPTVRKVLLDALAGTTPWSVVKEELSYIHGLLVSVNTHLSIIKL